MEPIPTFVLEEHHEALLAWNYALSHGMLDREKNMLLHFDEHADLSPPRMRRPLPLPATDFDELCRFVFDEIAIFEFIVPAIYQGIFDQLYWILPRGTPKQREQLFVYSEQSERRVLRFASQAAGMESDGRSALYSMQDITGGIAPRPSVALDIDLDYFSCEQAEQNRQRVEIVEREYRAFREDPYHFLRLNQGSRISMVEEDGRYFICMREYAEESVCPLKVTEAEIKRRVDEFAGFLRQTQVRPRMITIARSRISGYTPADQWELIEFHLLAALRDLFPLEVIPMSRLLPWPSAVPMEAAR